MHISRARIATAALISSAALAISGCSLSSSGTTAAEGSLAESADLEGVELTVGSKEFTEQQVMCHATALALESAGATVDRKCGLSGSTTVRAALESGDIDLYWEYTGTAWINYLKEDTPLKDSAKQYEEVAKRDLAENQIRWLEPSTANNTYAIAVKTSTAEKLGVSTLSEYAELAKSDPAKASTCVASEFSGRSDGWPGLQQTYGFKLPKAHTASLAQGAIFNAMDKGDPCTFGQATETDGRLKALQLTALEDDKKFFPIYNPAVTIKDSVYQQNPDVAKVLNPLAKALDTAALQDLNAQVDVDGKDSEDVSEDWLKSKGFIGE